MHKIHRIFAAAAAGAVALPAFAQTAPTSDADPAARQGEVKARPVDSTVNPQALGDLTFGPINVGALIGETGVLGVEYMNGQYFVTARVLTGDMQNRVFVFDSNGALVDEFVQQFSAQDHVWGYRDGMNDGEWLYFGWEGGMVRHRPTPPYDAELFLSTGGPNGNWRALAYDPDGDGGNGSFYAGDFGDAIIEVDMSGNTIRTLPNLDAWSIYGLALDPCTGNLWASHSSGGGANPPEIWEIDTTTGRWTGVTFPFDFGVPGTGGAFPIQGGLTGVPGGAGNSGNFFDLAAILQAESDALVGMEVHADPCGGGGLTLVADGTCPGSISFSIDGGTPNGNAALVYGFGTGPTTIPPGRPCAGTSLDVGNPNLNFRTIQLNASGQARLTTPVPGAACDRVIVQAIDLTSCDTSNTVQP